MRRGLKLGWAGQVALVAALPALVGLGAFVLVMLDRVHDDEARRLETDLLAQAKGFARVLQGPAQAPPLARISGMGRTLGARLTVIAEDGSVLADTDSVPTDMDNHGSRPEVIEATASGTAIVRRFSHTLQRELLYAAARVPDSRRVVRVARDISGIRASQKDRARMFWLVALAVLVVTLPLAIWFARRVTRPVLDLTRVAERIAAGDLDVHAVPRGMRRGERPDEIAQLGDAFNRMTARLAEALRTAEGEAVRLSMVLEGMTEGVIAVDAAERISFLNTAARRILQASEPVSEGTRLVEVLRDPRILELVQIAASRPEPVEAETSHEGPPRRLIQVYAAGTEGKEGGGVILVLRDISRLRRLERMRSDFVSNVSHELRTPLASIAAAAETLDDAAVRIDAEEGPRFVEMIARNGRRLEALLQDILSLSRMESRPETLPRERVDFSAVARSSVEELRPRAEAAGLELACPAAEPIPVMGDQATLRRVVDNLIVNAITYTPEGRIDVSLVVDDGHALLRVIDTGIGIPRRSLDRVFERFYRIDKPRSRSAGGTGLGLAIVKHAVGLHGGSVTVASKVGHGTTFTVRLPLESSGGDGRSRKDGPSPQDRPQRDCSS